MDPKTSVSFDHLTQMTAQEALIKYKGTEPHILFNKFLPRQYSDGHH